MELDVSPAIHAGLRRALLAALGEAGLRASSWSCYDDAWRRTALREGVRDEDDSRFGYALSPRSTRGATRA